MCIKTVKTRQKREKSQEALPWKLGARKMVDGEVFCAKEKKREQEENEKSEKKKRQKRR